MLNIFLNIILCAGQLQFLSPDELIGTKVMHREAPFGNPSLLKTYGKLLLYDITATCAYPASVIEKIKSSIIVIYSAEEFNCSPDVLAVQASYYEAEGIIIIWTHYNYAGNSIALTKVYPFRGTFSSKVTIFCILIDENAGNVIKSYSDKNIWVSYNQKRIPVADSTISIYLSSDYSSDYEYIDILSQIFQETIPSDTKFNIYLLYLNNSRNATYDCYNSTEKKSYCLTSDSKLYGSQKIQSSMLAINLYNDQGIVAFFSYYKSLHTCISNFSIDCNKAVIRNLGFTPNLNESALIKSYILYSQMIPSVSSHKIFCYNPEYLKDLVKVAFKDSGRYCGSGCTLDMLDNEGCDVVCNVSDCSYDNMNCLNINGCPWFIIGDGNCNKACTEDTDCSSGGVDDNSWKIIVGIIVSVAFIIIVILVILVICIRRKYRSKAETSDNMMKDIVPTCCLCGDIIESDQNPVRFNNICTHNYHQVCHNDYKKQKDDSVECPECVKTGANLR